ncbi:hypothetical protein [Neiella marina]|uniref:hypothetical protein n=1 Tax=Neiella marina TaxID=508461 RepID=UPI001302C09F|nr:hypothetical protein [Neiella marina]
MKLSDRSSFFSGEQLHPKSPLKQQPEKDKDKQSSHTAVAVKAKRQEQQHKGDQISV